MICRDATLGAFFFNLSISVSYNDSTDSPIRIDLPTVYKLNNGM